MLPIDRWSSCISVGHLAAIAAHLPRRPEEETMEVRVGEVGSWTTEQVY